MFLDVRDAAGLVQVVVDPEQPGCEAAHRVRNEWVLRVEGSVRPRPEGTVNADLPTGEIEVAAAAVEVLNEAESPPFPLDDRADVDEVLRLRYRYLDLRRAPMQRNLRVRADVNHSLRATMRALNFVEIETPMLIASTPEGARDFIVPSRLQPGSFYALPQSPQLFKQLTMVGGLDRYFQIARCLRDEDLRADRQFEFMQLDLEMSFADQEDVLDAVSAAILAAAETVRPGEAPAEIPRMTWLEGMERYGTDKPDIRFGMELVELTEVFAATEFKAFVGAEAIKAIRVEGEGDMTRSKLDALTERAKSLGAAGLVWMRVREGGALESPVVKFCSEAEQLGIVDAVGACAGDLVLIVAGERADGAQRAGPDPARPRAPARLRRIVVPVDRRLPAVRGPRRRRPADARAPCVHVAPPRRPRPARIGSLAGAVTFVRPRAQRVELGSGSVRIHRNDVQQRIFSLIGIAPKRRRSGSASCSTRSVSAPRRTPGSPSASTGSSAILAGEENIREVIAFPKTQSGVDPLTNAPTPVDDRQLQDLGLRLTKPI